MQPFRPYLNWGARDCEADAVARLTYPETDAIDLEIRIGLEMPCYLKFSSIYEIRKDIRNQHIRLHKKKMQAAKL